MTDFLMFTPSAVFVAYTGPGMVGWIGSFFLAVAGVIVLIASAVLVRPVKMAISHFRRGRGANTAAGSATETHNERNAE